MAEFLLGALAPGGQAVVVDPDRSFWESLVIAAKKIGLRVKTDSLPPRSADEPPRSLLIRCEKGA